MKKLDKKIYATMLTCVVIIILHVSNEEVEEVVTPTIITLRVLFVMFCLRLAYLVRTRQRINKIFEKMNEAAQKRIFKIEDIA
ncbi:hypothetical protein [Butyrivibrio sp. AE2005]|uniref:hypothetical protein n=1 Tax=Butyrivibrio sp. AE2005 TaxID=1496722 RepID=UPI00047BF315|nr:hypothetical protein [Butyrivibrio sp. AE2005]